MDDDPSSDPDRREFGACWVIPGAMLLLLLVMTAFISQVTAPLQADTAPPIARATGGNAG